MLGRKVTMQAGAGLRLLSSRIVTTIERARSGTGGDAGGDGGALETVWNRIVEVTATLGSTDDREVALANASLYLEAVGHTVVAWMWLEQLSAVADKPGVFYDGKRHAARFFYAHELPKVVPQLDLLGRLDRTTIDMNPACF